MHTRNDGNTLNKRRHRNEAASAALSGRLTNLAEVAMRLVDLLPLHSHFGALPGDEKAWAKGQRFVACHGACNLGRWSLRGCPSNAGSGV